MKRMVIEIEDDNFHYTIKERAFAQRKSVKDYVIGLIEKDLREEEQDAGSSQGK